MFNAPRFYSFAFNKIKATREEALALLAKTDELRKVPGEIKCKKEKKKNGPKKCTDDVVVCI